MAWDDELNALASYVRKHFGSDEVKAAGRRAMATLTPMDLVDPVDTDDVIEGADGQFYDADEFWEAVRHELRWLVTPH